MIIFAATIIAIGFGGCHRYAVGITNTTGSRVGVVYVPTRSGSFGLTGQPVPPDKVFVIPGLRRGTRWGGGGAVEYPNPLLALKWRTGLVSVRAGGDDFISSWELLESKDRDSSAVAGEIFIVSDNGIVEVRATGDLSVRPVEDEVVKSVVKSIFR